MNYKGIKLDRFQTKAIEGVNQDHSVIVSAPTGAGKTLIAEFLIERCLQNGQGIIYTAPIKALSNQKYRQFRNRFPDKTGIITGDVSIDAQSPLLIMTTEIFKNRILENESSFNTHNWIIFDEIHYLDDRERGTVWEESLIFLPPHFRFLGLSATIPNIDEFAKWIELIHKKPVLTVEESQRPVPLHFNFICHGKISNNIHKLKMMGFWKPHKYGSAYRNIGSKSSKGNPFSQVHKLLKQLKKRQHTPAIYFSFSRKRTEELALYNAKASYFESDNASKQSIAVFDQLATEFGIAHFDRTQELRELVKQGIAYHHAGLLPMQKELIEQLFTLKLIRVIFTTETFALGINMPAKTVIIDTLKKKYDRFFKILKTRDFFQMAGRAGRRGLDTKGFIYSFVDPVRVSYDELYFLSKGKPEPIFSRFNATYSTILNLYEIYGEQLLEIYKKSFHFYQQKRKKHSLAFKQMRGRLDTLKELDYIQNGQLTEKGHFAKKIHGYGLILSELNDSGALDLYSYEQLANLALAIVFEPKPKARIPKLPDEIRKIKGKTADVIDKIHVVESFFGVVELSKRCYFDLSDSLTDWMKEKPFEEIVEKIQSDEGELIRYYRMSIQLLREILNTPLDKTTKAKVETAIALMNHGAIDAEIQLRKITEFSLEETERDL